MAMTAAALVDDEISGERAAWRPHAGDLVDGYRLIRRIGRGGTGTVWEAHRLTDGRPVAMKILAADMLHAYPELADRLVREWEACSRIGSRRVVKVLGHGQREGVPFLVMELVYGETLFDRVHKEGPLPVEDVVHIVAGVAEALHEAHVAGVIHRDIKAGNIMLTDEGVKVLDFGFAKLQQQQNRRPITQEGISLGSPTYMSPEQFLGSSTVDHRTDLWALCVVAYFALTGIAPFSGLSFVTIAAAVLEHRYAAPSVHREELDARIDAFFARAFATCIEERYQDAEELAATFGAFAPPKLTPLTMPSPALALTGEGSGPRQQQIDHAMRAALVPVTGRHDPLKVMAVAFTCTLIALLAGVLAVMAT